MVVAAKRDGRVRLRVDLRHLNQAIVPDVFPLPHLDDLLVELHGARWFSKLDALSAYHQVKLDERSRDLTTFVTQWVLFRYKRVCFGLASAPAAFQRLMKNLLQGLKGVVIYLDDILVFGASKEEHNVRLRIVLQRIQESGMTLNEKCDLGTKEINFVGFTINEHGVRPSVDNLKAIKELAVPTNVTQVKSVLGVSSFYMRYVPTLSDISEPIRRLFKKNVLFKWGPEQQQAFEKLKASIGGTFSHFRSNSIHDSGDGRVSARIRSSATARAGRGRAANSVCIVLANTYTAKVFHGREGGIGERVCDRTVAHVPVGKKVYVTDRPSSADSTTWLQGGGTSANEDRSVGRKAEKLLI